MRNGPIGRLLPMPLILSDPRHIEDGSEALYAFRNADTLIADFWTEVDEWLAKNGS
jgi:hypothetical protein